MLLLRSAGCTGSYIANYLLCLYISIYSKVQDSYLIYNRTHHTKYIFNPFFVNIYNFFSPKLNNSPRCISSFLFNVLNYNSLSCNFNSATHVVSTSVNECL